MKQKAAETKSGRLLNKINWEIELFLIQAPAGLIEMENKETESAKQYQIWNDTFENSVFNDSMTMVILSGCRNKATAATAAATATRVNTTARAFSSSIILIRFVGGDIGIGSLGGGKVEI